MAKVRLKKELTLFSIYSIATGATISGGIFLIPGLAYAAAGPFLIISYVIAVIPLIPAVFSISELSTAMPRAGGMYFFLDRSMGPLVGTIGGLGTWFALVLKTAFAFTGIGAYLSFFVPDVSFQILAVVFVLIFGMINLIGAKFSGRLQVVFVFILLILMTYFIFSGFAAIRWEISPFLSQSFETAKIFSTAGLVYVSYIGITKIASVSEEVKDPERTIPIAMGLALLTALIIYVAGNYVIVNVTPGEILANNLTPVAVAADSFMSPWGVIVMTAAAIIAFLSVANAGILSSSRYPLAMSRDHLLPAIFRRISRRQTPHFAIISTVILVIILLLFLDISKIVKLAGAFQLLLFALCSAAVIVMRESKIDSYDPGFKSPLYPWMQIFGIIAPLWLIYEMGWLASLFSLGLLLSGAIWYFYYASGKVAREGAIYHMFARWGEQKYEGLDSELRGILKEKGLREKDPFDQVVAAAEVIDLNKDYSFEDVVGIASTKLSQVLLIDKQRLLNGFMEGTMVGATPVSHGAALPHIRLAEIKHSEMLLIRSQKGVKADFETDFYGEEAKSQPIHAFFFLVSPENNPGLHLRLLAQVASHVDDSDFMDNWLNARNEQELKELLLRDDHYISLHITKKAKTAELLNITISNLNFPKDCLIAMIHREGRFIIPHGDVILKENDRLTIIGYPESISQLYSKYES